LADQVEAVALLTSDVGAGITGSVVNVDGGICEY